MAKEACTLGPWRVSQWSTAEAWITGPKIAEGPQKGKPTLIAMSVLNRDAPLIAAAPDLLNAAEVALTTLCSISPKDRTVEDDEAIEWLTKAIAKARGEA